SQSLIFRLISVLYPLGRSIEKSCKYAAIVLLQGLSTSASVLACLLSRASVRVTKSSINSSLLTTKCTGSASSSSFERKHPAAVPISPRQENQRIFPAYTLSRICCCARTAG